MALARHRGQVLDSDALKALVLEKDEVLKLLAGWPHLDSWRRQLLKALQAFAVEANATTSHSDL